MLRLLLSHDLRVQRELPQALVCLLIRGKLLLVDGVKLLAQGLPPLSDVPVTHTAIPEEAFNTRFMDIMVIDQESVLGRIWASLDALEKGRKPAPA